MLSSIVPIGWHHRSVGILHCDVITFPLLLVVAGSVPFVLISWSEQTPTTMRGISTAFRQHFESVCLVHHSMSSTHAHEDDPSKKLRWRSIFLCHHSLDLLENLRGGMSRINSPTELYPMTCKIMRLSIIFNLHQGFDVLFACFH